LKDKEIAELKQMIKAESVQILELEERITKFAEKEVKMRENILILEE